jgi:hypothetical protein
MRARIASLSRASVLVRLGRLRVLVVRYERQCPRCGAEFAGEDKNKVADAVIAHAASHGHALDSETVLAHLEGVHPYEREPD